MIAFETTYFTLMSRYELSCPANQSRRAAQMNSQKNSKEQILPKSRQTTRKEQFPRGIVWLYMKVLMMTSQKDYRYRKYTAARQRVNKISRNTIFYHFFLFVCLHVLKDCKLFLVVNIINRIQLKSEIGLGIR